MDSHNRLIEFAGDQLSKYLSANPNEANAKLATKEHRDARISVCQSCEYKTKVKVKPYLPAVDGCEKCSCPFITKARMIEHFRIPSLKDNPLTESEVKRIKKGEESIRIITECPHENGNKWADVDKKFNT